MKADLPTGLRFLLADNPGPFTLDGTRTFLVGRRSAAIVDPGPDLAEHREAIVRALLEGGVREAAVLLTHHHPDHAGGAGTLVRRLREEGVAVRTPAGGSTSGDEAPEVREIETDAGRLRAVATPGHTRDHVAFHWLEHDAVFAGDLVLGTGSTAWVGSYPGCVADYLRSLDRIGDLEVRRLHPAHGDVIEDPQATLERFRRHRLARIEQVRDVVAEDPGASAEDMVSRIYGDALPADLRSGAVWSVRAILHHLGKREFPDPGPSVEG